MELSAVGRSEFIIYSKKYKVYNFWLRKQTNMIFQMAEKRRIRKKDWWRFVFFLPLSLISFGSYLLFIIIVQLLMWSAKNRLLLRWVRNRTTVKNICENHKIGKNVFLKNCFELREQRWKEWPNWGGTHFAVKYESEQIGFDPKMRMDWINLCQQKCAGMPQKPNMLKDARFSDIFFAWKKSFQQKVATI